MAVSFSADPRWRHLSLEQVRKLYEEERKLREYLLASPKGKRTEAFCFAYDELFRRCPWHPALTERSGVAAPEVVERRLRNLLKWLPSPECTRVLEIGCGMGELMIGLSQKGYQCVGIDVADVRIRRLQELRLPNAEFQKVEGTQLPFPSRTFDVAASMQLIEHLHPEDAGEHLREVSRVLKSGGVYFLETPNRLTGPGDVSRFFSETALGFHLKEYTIRELTALFLQNGFTSVQILLRWSRLLSRPTAIALEAAWSILPKATRRRHTYGMHNPVYCART